MAEEAARVLLASDDVLVGKGGTSTRPGPVAGIPGVLAQRGR